MAKNDRGSALVMAVFVLALLTGLGVALLFLSQSSVRQTSAGLRAKKAFYMAESGIEHGRLQLNLANDGVEFDDDLDVAAGLNDGIDLDPAALGFTWDADGTVSGVVGVGDDQPIRQLTQISFMGEQGWYTAYLSNDPLEAGGLTDPDDTNSRLMLTAIGGSQSRATETVQAIIEPFQYVPPVPPAAITMLGPLPDFNNGNSNAQSHTGNDCGGRGGPFAPIVGTVGSDARGQVQGDMERPEHFSSGPLPYTGRDTIADLDDPTDPIVADAGNGTLDPFWKDCEGLKSLVEFLRRGADYYCNSDDQVCDTFPATGPGGDDIVFIDGDLTETPSGSYAGILIVTGQLTYDGNTGWDGLILAIGEGNILRNGGGGGNPSGAVIIANIDPSPDGPRVDRSDWCTAGTDGFQQSHYESQGGGNSTVEWCTGAIDGANSVRSYRVVQFLQR